MISALLFTAVLSGCKRGVEEIPSTSESKTEETFLTESVAVPTQVEYFESVFSTETESTKPVTQKAHATTKAPTEAFFETQAESESSTKYARTGESVFTDDPSNKYIAAVAEKYDLNAALLAAVYTIPDADGNMVMEFDGTTDENGRLIRNADTLIAIYTVDKSLNSKRASNDSSKNEYSLIESKTIFFSVTKYIIPKFENELSRVQFDLN